MHRTASAVLAVLASVALLAAAAMPASAKQHRHHGRRARAALSVHWVTPKPGQVIRSRAATRCVARVRARAGIRRMRLLLDGRRLPRAKQLTRKGRRCLVGRVSAAALRGAGGRHRLTLRVLDRRGRRTSATVRFKIRPSHRPGGGSTPGGNTGAGDSTGSGSTGSGSTGSGSTGSGSTGSGSTPTQPTTPAPAPAWSADYSTGDFRQWTFSGQGQSYMWGHISVAPFGNAGVPAPPTGSRNVAQMSVTGDDAAAGRYHAKLYNYFPVSSNLAGTYTSWYYIPSSYALPTGSWSNIFQFKDEFGPSGGSDPLWWVYVVDAGTAKGMNSGTWSTPRPARDSAPVAFLAFWNDTANRHRRVYTALPLDRWFQIRAQLHPGDRIDFTIDGKPFDTGRQSEYPVTPFHRDSGNLIFGAGNYATAPSTLFLSNAAFYRGWFG